MEDLTGFGMKNCSTLPSLAIKSFNKLRDENTEPIYTYNDEYMRHFVRKIIKGGRCASYNQQYKSSISDEVFIIVSRKLNVNGNVCEILVKYLEYTTRYRKMRESEYDSQIKDYRDNDKEERTEHINKDPNTLPIQKNYRN